MSKVEALKTEIAEFAQSADEETLIVVRDILSDANEQRSLNESFGNPESEEFLQFLREAASKPYTGKTYTSEEVHRMVAEKRAEWRQR